MGDFQQTLMCIRKVVAFGSRSTMAKIIGEEISPEEFRSARKACKVLAEADLYPFDVNGTDEALMEQIADFMQKGLEES